MNLSSLDDSSRATEGKEEYWKGGGKEGRQERLKEQHEERKSNGERPQTNKKESKVEKMRRRECGAEETKAWRVASGY